MEEAVAAKSLPALSLQLLRKKKQNLQHQKQVQKRKPKNLEPAKPAVAKEEAKPAEPVAPKTEKVVAKPQSRNFKAEREARAKEQAERRKQNKGNNRDQQQNGNRQKTTVVMVENKVKATATIVALMTKLRNSKVSKIVETSAVNKRTNVQIKRLHVLTLKPAAALKAESKMQSMPVQGGTFQADSGCQRSLGQANKRKEPEEIFEEAG